MADYDVWFGRTPVAQVDWRKMEAVADDADDDEPRAASKAVQHILGFDPSDDGEDEVEQAAGRLPHQPPADEGRSAVFNAAKERYRQLDDEAIAASRRLNAIKGVGSGRMGLTPDSVKFSLEFIAANKAYNLAAGRLKTYTAWYVKQFKKEITAERRDPEYHAKRQAELRRRREQGFVIPPETAAAKVRRLKRLPTKAQSVQHPVNVRARDRSLNQLRPGMHFLHKTEQAAGQPVRMKVFAVKAGAVYYDEPEARKPGFYCDPTYFYSKIFKEWVK